MAFKYLSDDILSGFDKYKHYNMDVAAVQSASTHIPVGTLLYLTCTSRQSIHYPISSCLCFTINVREAHVSFMGRQGDRYLVLILDSQAQKLEHTPCPCIVRINSSADFEYNAIDTSPVSNYITHPFWNWCVQFYPKWIAPNVLTLGGFLFLVLQVGIMSYYDFNFYASSDIYPDYPPIPKWAWLVSAFCIFAAHTLDGTDGKQARRTGTTGPLGELFDHGLDSWATLILPIGIYSVFGRGDFSVDVDRVYFTLVYVHLTFIVSHWEKYNTGVLYLPWGYDISQIAMTVVFLITYIGDYTMWKFDVPLFGITSGEACELLMQAGVLLLSVPVSLWNVYVSYRDGTGKMLSFYESIRPMVGSLVLFALFLTWAIYSPYSIIIKEPRIFYIASGTVFSNIACRLIVNGMSSTRCELLNWLLVPLAAIVAAVLTLPLGVLERYLLWTYLLVVFGAHLHYGFCVVQQLADHFNIYIFFTSKPPPKVKGTKAAQD